MVNLWELKGIKRLLPLWRLVNLGWQSFWRLVLVARCVILYCPFGIVFNNVFFCFVFWGNSGIIWLRTFTLPIRRRWFLTSPISTLRLECPSGWRNSLAMFVVNFAPLFFVFTNNCVCGYRVSLVIRRVMQARLSTSWTPSLRGWIRLRGSTSISITVRVEWNNPEFRLLKKNWRPFFSKGLMTAQEININPVNALMNSDGTPTQLGNIYIGN